VLDYQKTKDILDTVCKVYLTGAEFKDILESIESVGIATLHEPQRSISDFFE
jgi:hypothetical protein